MNAAKIHLSPQETELLANTEWLLLKEQIIQKIISLFGEMHELFRENIIENRSMLPSFISEKGGKISKGNYFKGLPYVVLDYPACFEKKNIFVVRCFFWWGNYFIISLHLSGKYMPHGNDQKKWLTYFKEKNFSINKSEDEWCQDWDDCYEEIELNKIPAANNFLKFAAKINISPLDEVPEFLEYKFREILSFYRTNYHLCDETVL
jgi:hypothetical protein